MISNDVRETGAHSFLSFPPYNSKRDLSFNTIIFSPPPFGGPGMMDRATRFFLSPPIRVLTPSHWPRDNHMGFWVSLFPRPDQSEFLF